MTFGRSFFFIQLDPVQLISGGMILLQVALLVLLPSRISRSFVALTGDRDTAKLDFKRRKDHLQQQQGQQERHISGRINVETASWADGTT